MYASKADCIIELEKREDLAQFKSAERSYRSSSGRSGIRDPVAHKTYTTKARRRDILLAAGEESSEANQVAASNQDTMCGSHKVPNYPLSGLRTW